MPVEQAVLDFYPLEELTSDNGRACCAACSSPLPRDGGERQSRGRAEGGPLRRDGRPHVLRGAPLARRRRPPRHGRRGRGARRRRRPGHQHRRPPGRRAALRPHPADGRPGRHRRRGRADGRAAGRRPRRCKQQIGLGAAPDGMAARPPLASSRRSARTFVDEVRGSLDYYLASSGSTPISRLVLTGGGARLGGLADRLQTTTRIPVEVGTPHAHLQVGRTGLSPGADRIRRAAGRRAGRPGPRSRIMSTSRPQPDWQPCPG